MKNLYGTLKTVIKECESLGAYADWDVIARLKMTLCFETEDSSYNYWMREVQGYNENIEGK